MVTPLFSTGALRDDPVLLGPVRTSCFCRAELKILQLGSTVAREENNSDSDVKPELNQIQDLLMHRNNSPSNSAWERNPSKIHL